MPGHGKIQCIFNDGSTLESDIGSLFRHSTNGSVRDIISMETGEVLYSQFGYGHDRYSSEGINVIFGSSYLL